MSNKVQKYTIVDIAKQWKTMREFTENLAESGESFGKVTFSKTDIIKVLRMYGFYPVQEADEKMKALKKSDIFGKNMDISEYDCFVKSYNDIAYEAFIYRRPINSPYPTDYVVYFDNANLKALLKEIKGTSNKYFRLHEQADKKFDLIDEKYTTDECRKQQWQYGADYLKGKRYSEQEVEKKFPCLIERNRMLDGVWEASGKALVAFQEKYKEFFTIVENRDYYVEGYQEVPAGTIFEGCHSLEETIDFYELLWRYNRMVFLQAGAKPEYGKRPGRKGYTIDVILSVQEEFRKKYEKFHNIHLEIPRKGFTHITQSEEKRLAVKHGVGPDIVHSIARRGAWETALENTAIEFQERIPKYQVYKMIKSKRYKIVI